MAQKPHWFHLRLNASYRALGLYFCTGSEVSENLVMWTQTEPATDENPNAGIGPDGLKNGKPISGLEPTCGTTVPAADVVYTQFRGTESIHGKQRVRTRT